jgi:hypothetical protein
MIKNFLFITLFALISSTAFAERIESASLKILDLEANSLVMEYQTLPTVIPAQNGHWIGLWEGTVYPANLPYLASHAVAVKKITLNESKSTVAMNNLEFKRNTDYTLIYFNSADVSQPSVIIHFNASEIKP